MQDIPDDPGLGDACEPATVVEAAPAAERPRQGESRRLDAETRRRIGRSLRVLYAGVLAQPIPERFAVLVAELAARSGEESSR